ncbi:hypothetical protein D9M68_676750 [compost metagenome]
MFLGSTSAPNSQAWPSLAGNRPVSIFMVVDLPQPLEPRKPNISPFRMRKLTWSTATKSPNFMVRSRASMAISASSPTASGTISTGLWPRRLASGSSAMKAASRESAPVRRSSSAGVPVASTRPSSMAISQSKRSASSM